MLLFITGVMSVESGAGYIDYNTIGVLVGMMLLRICGEELRAL